MTNWLSDLLNSNQAARSSAAPKKGVDPAWQASGNATEMASVTWHASRVVPGVRFGIRRVSLLQRMELLRRLKAMTARHDFLASGNPMEQADASLMDLAVKELYLEWGVAELRGLRIDREAADIQVLIAKGPQDLCDEIVDVIRASIDISEQERKNS